MQEETSLAAGSRVELDELVPYLAGLVGQATVDRLAGRAHPELDQHMAAVSDAARDILGRHHADPAKMLTFLVRYASGFVAAATAGGWRPASGWWPAGGAPPADWESMRLAAVCQLVADQATSAD